MTQAALTADISEVGTIGLEGQYHPLNRPFNDKLLLRLMFNSLKINCTLSDLNY